MKELFASERISFVEVSEELVPCYLVMVNDVENVAKYLGTVHPPYTEEQEIKWVKKKLEENAPVFSMIEKSTGQFIGNIELMTIQNGTGELGIGITAAMQDKGFGTEAIRALFTYVKERWGLNRMILRARPFNNRALHVYRKCGFREYDRNEEHVFMEIDLA